MSIMDNLPISPQPGMLKLWSPVPPELVDNIIDYLHDDSVALKNCSLVCHSWILSSRYHLFRQVSLDFIRFTDRVQILQYDHYAHRKCRILHQCLENSPYVASYIRRLIIRPGALFNSGGLEKTTRAVSAVLRKLTNLKRLDLVLASWKSLAPHFQDSICTMLRLPSVTHLHILRCHFDTFQDLSSLISHSPGLKELRLQFITFLRISRIGAEQDSTRPVQVHTLRFDGHIQTLSQWVSWPRCSVDLTKLRSLHLQITPGLFMSAGQLVHTVGASLEYLELYAPYQPKLADCFIDLSRTPHLQRLYLPGILHSRTYNPVPWIESLFSRLKSPLFLEEIEMHVVFDRGSEISPPEFNWSAWNHLDAAFTQPQMSRLRKFHLVFRSDSGDEVERLGCQFPQLEAQGILSIVSQR